MARDVLISPDALVATDQLMRDERCIDHAHVAYLALLEPRLDSATRAVAEASVAAAKELAFIDPDEAAKMLDRAAALCLRSVARAGTN